MTRWQRLVSGVDGERVIVALGILYVALAAEQTFSVVAASEPLGEALLTFLQVGGPGVALLYGGYWLPRTELRREAYPRIVAWTLGASVVMFGVVGLLLLDPGITVSHPLWSIALATSIGNVGGFAIGTNEARAITRAREAEEHEQRLQRQNDRLESFASMLAHELRNPLNIAQIYLPQAADGDRDAAEEAATALDRIEEMIDVLLITARSTDLDINWEQVALEEVATDAWADLSGERANLVVETERTVRADPVHLRHLLENLFRNAVEHGSTSNPPEADDAVEHGSTSSRPSADDAVEHGDEDVTIRVGDIPSGFYVEDDGPGISADLREAVFEAGYTTGVSGIGLGLTLVAQLVETYDWDYVITESEWGGARFEFTNVGVVEGREHRPS